MAFSSKDEKPKNPSGPNVTLRIPNSTLDKWNIYCEKSNLSRSELIKQAVDEKISGYLEVKIDELLLHYFKPLDRKLDQILEDIKKLKQ
jgi:hypothetical protein